MQAVNPNVAKAGELQSQGAEGKTVIIYCEPPAMLDLEFSGFPARVNNMAKTALSLEFTIGDFQKKAHGMLFRM